MSNDTERQDLPEDERQMARDLQAANLATLLESAANGQVTAIPAFIIGTNVWVLLEVGEGDGQAFVRSVWELFQGKGLDNPDHQPGDHFRLSYEDHTGKQQTLFSVCLLARDSRICFTTDTMKDVEEFLDPNSPGEIGGDKDATKENSEGSNSEGTSEDNQ